jgi:hypothetical protein
MSTANESSSTGWVARNRSPSAIPRRPALGRATWSVVIGGTGGSFQVAQNETPNRAASTR